MIGRARATLCRRGGSLCTRRDESDARRHRMRWTRRRMVRYPRANTEHGRMSHHDTRRGIQHNEWLPGAAACRVDRRPHRPGSRRARPGQELQRWSRAQLERGRVARDGGREMKLAPPGTEFNGQRRLRDEIHTDPTRVSEDGAVSRWAVEVRRDPRPAADSPALAGTIRSRLRRLRRPGRRNAGGRAGRGSTSPIEITSVAVPACRRGAARSVGRRDLCRRSPSTVLTMALPSIGRPASATSTTRRAAGRPGGSTDRPGTGPSLRTS